ncbi:hypothetical protein [Microbacterium gorillae]|uniref:hypothetical protein n=1 Tax=Microbacterium gorillae TaxID=1231063 RepID=UPI000590033A|nr:hypothetical protein [Microbacterium gorillae]
MFWAGQVVASDGGTAFDIWSDDDPEDTDVPAPAVIEARRGDSTILLFDAGGRGGPDGDTVALVDETSVTWAEAKALGFD